MGHRSLNIFDAITGKPLLTREEPDRGGIICEWSRNGRWLGLFNSLLCIGVDVWDEQTGAMIHLDCEGKEKWGDQEHGKDEALDAVVFSDDSEQVIVHTTSRRLTFSTETGAFMESNAPWTAEDWRVYRFENCALPPDGWRIVAASKDGGRILVEDDRRVLWLQDMEAREGKRALLQEQIAIADWAGAVFSADGRRVVTTHLGKCFIDDSACTVCVFDSASGQRLCIVQTDEGSCHPVISRDGRYLASGTTVGLVYLWDTSMVDEINPPDVDGAPVESVLFSPDGKQVAAVSSDSLCVWNCTNGSVIRKLQRCGGEAQGKAAVVFAGAGIGAILEWENPDENERTSSSGPEQPSFRAISQGAETAIVSSDGTELAWFPVALDNLETHPAGRAWAGSQGSHLCLFTLEQGRPSPGDLTGDNK
jgi:WD40 repeat protein